MARAAVSRRTLLAASGAVFAWTQLPRLARAEGRDPRLMVVVLRGALDGLAAVAPVGDPGWEALRGDRGLKLEGKIPALPLDPFFALHPAMGNFHRLYGARQALVAHAVATPYRDRSHFDGQDILESGHAGPGAGVTGWLNRALAGLASDGRVASNGTKALGMGAVPPLVIRGPAPVMAWVPERVPQASPDTASRLLELYRHTDPVLAASLESSASLAAVARDGGLAQDDDSDYRRAAPGIAKFKAYLTEAMSAAGKYLGHRDGPRVAAIAVDGWDTHSNEGAAEGRLAQILGGLDGAIATFEGAVGEAWRETAMVFLTEFGRTAHINGSFGTDHGTGTVALVAGGAVKGGRVLADWPGIKEDQLYEARDLKPTTDLRALLKGVLRDHLRVEEAALSRDVFPDSAAAKPIEGLVG